MLKTNQIILWIIAIIVIAGLIWLGYSEKEVVEEEEVIKIGVSLPLSGNYAYIGQSEANGLQMAIDEINEKEILEENKIILIIEDNRGDSKEAISSINKMIEVDDVDIIFSTFTNIVEAIHNIVLNNNKILFYNSTIRSLADKSKYIFRDYVNIEDAGDFVAKIVDKLGYEKIGYIGPNDVACLQMKERIQKNIQLVRVEEFLPDEKDLKSNLLKLKSENLDAITSCSYIHAHILMRQLKELGMIDIPIIHGWGHFLPLANTEEMRELFRENNSFETWYAISEIAKDKSQRLFFEKYEEKFGMIPSPAGLYSYDDGYIIAEAIKNCGNVMNNDCFVENINNQEFEGIAEKIKFDETGNAIRKMILVKMNDNLEWEEVELDEL